MIDDTSLNNNQPVDNSSEGVTPAVTDPQTPQPVADFPVQPVPSAVPVPPVITASTSFDNSPLPPENNSPTVAVSDQAGNVPKWFYLIFGVTLIIFFVVTGLLIMSFVQQPNKETGKVIPNIIPTETTGNITLVPTLTPTPTPLSSESAVLKLLQLKPTDEIGDIEDDLKNTDLSLVSENINLLETAASITPTLKK